MMQPGIIAQRCRRFNLVRCPFRYLLRSKAIQPASSRGRAATRSRLPEPPKAAGRCCNRTTAAGRLADSEKFGQARPQLSRQQLVAAKGCTSPAGRLQLLQEQLCGASRPHRTEAAAGRLGASCCRRGSGGGAARARDGMAARQGLPGGGGWQVQQLRGGLPRLGHDCGAPHTHVRPVGPGACADCAVHRDAVAALLALEQTRHQVLILRFLLLVYDPTYVLT